MNEAFGTTARMTARACPICGGAVYRELPLLAIIGFFLPVHFFTKARHRCSGCGTAFKSRPNISDLILMILFAGVIGILQGFWWFALVMLALWLVVAIGLRSDQKRAAPVHTVFAGVFLAALWVTGLVAKSEEFSKLMVESGAGVFGASMGVGFLFGLTLHFLDRAMPPHLSRVAS